MSGAPDVKFDIVTSDDQFSFDVQRRSNEGMIMGKKKGVSVKFHIYFHNLTNMSTCPPGVVRQVKPIIGPKSFKLEVAMKYTKPDLTSYSNIVIIRIFISEFWF